MKLYPVKSGDGAEITPIEGGRNANLAMGPCDTLRIYFHDENGQQRTATVHALNKQMIIVDDETMKELTIG